MREAIDSGTYFYLSFKTSSDDKSHLVNQPLIEMVKYMRERKDKVTCHDSGTLMKSLPSSILHIMLTIRPSCPRCAPVVILSPGNPTGA